MNILNSIFLTALFVPATLSIGFETDGVHDRHQAMYLVNLVRNMDWDGDKITIGVIGESLVTDELEILAERNAKIFIRTLNQFSSIRECNIVFLPGASNSDFYLAQKEIADLPILLVVDKKPLVVRGAEIGFYTEDDKLKIAMNTKEIEKTGIKISQSLMEKAALN